VTGGTIEVQAKYGVNCGTGQINPDTTYSVTVQAAPGCIASGETLSFLNVSAGIYANQTSTLPATPGANVILPLIFPAPAAPQQPVPNYSVANTPSGPMPGACLGTPVQPGQFCSNGFVGNTTNPTCILYSSTTGACISYALQPAPAGVPCAEFGVQPGRSCVNGIVTNGVSATGAPNSQPYCASYSVATGACIAYGSPPGSLPAPAPPTPAGASAPARFSGAATASSGAVLSGGTIEAMVSGMICGSGQIGATGSYSISLQASPGCTSPGGTISFWLVTSGEYALQTGTVPFTPGGSVLLNLVFPT